MEELPLEMEHPRGKEEYGTIYIYMFAYDAQQIIDMVDQVVITIEQTE